MLRVVLDTNVLVSGTIVSHGAPARIIQALMEGGLEMVTSQALFDEYKDVMQRRHIVRKYDIADRVREVSLLLQINVIPLTAVPLVISEDPDDNVVLACAVEGRANYIVSGDPHLLNLREYQGIQIVTPRQMVEVIEQSKEES